MEDERNNMEEQKYRLQEVSLHAARLAPGYLFVLPPHRRLSSASGAGGARWPAARWSRPKHAGEFWFSTAHFSRRVVADALCCVLRAGRGRKQNAREAAARARGGARPQASGERQQGAPWFSHQKGSPSRTASKPCRRALFPRARSRRVRTHTGRADDPEGEPDGEVRSRAEVKDTAFVPCASAAFVAETAPFLLRSVLRWAKKEAEQLAARAQEMADSAAADAEKGDLETAQVTSRPHDT